MTRGVPTSKSLSPWWVANSSQFILVDKMCVIQGDSGGSVFRNNTAYGIISGGSNTDKSYCGQFGDDWAVFGAIEFVMSRQNVQLLSGNHPTPPNTTTTLSPTTTTTCTVTIPVAGCVS